MQEQFYRLDRFQSDIGGSVRRYAELLPDRAARTGTVPGWQALDEQASEAIVAYLGALDAFDPLEDCPATRLPEAMRTFRELTDRLGYLGNDMESYLDRFGPELRRVGEARRRVEARVTAAQERVAQAVSAWERLAADGYQFDAVDRAVAQARIAGRKLEAAAPRLTPDSAAEACRVVEKQAGDAAALAAELGRRSRSLGSRIPSLRTRVDALQNRAESVPETLRCLRREFSAPNWEDLSRGEGDLARRLDQARGLVADLERRHETGDHAGALSVLDEIEGLLDRIGEVVDGPRARLTLLRGMRDEPRRSLDRVRFRLRDARYLVQDGRPVADQPWAGRLDAAAAAFLAVEPALQARHPDYWSVHQRLTALEATVDRLVADFRAAR